MIPLPFLAGQKIGVMGLGRSGRSAARALAASGAHPWVWDDNESARASAEGLELRDPATADLSDTAFLLWSPGIPHTLPAPHILAQRARAAGVRLLCDVELLAVACATQSFVGITGTNGKSTTTALTAHLFAAAGGKVAAGGNLGIPALDLPVLGAEGIYVLELSSYQLELLDRARFDVAILLNLSPDHLDRHGGMKGYAAAKDTLFDRLRAGATAIIGIDDEHGALLASRLAHSGIATIRISAERNLEHGISAPDGILHENGEVVADLRPIGTLPGRHNWQNACAAFAAARALGLGRDEIRRGLATYPGLAHRQELVAVIDGVRYVNDSKATNADATAKALVCYDDIYWILGGQAKEGGIDALAPLFGRVRRAFLIGEAAADFAETLAGRVPAEMCGTLDVALARARAAAVGEGRPAATVLLSPACASWDQFKSFEHRGDAFRTLVEALPGGRAAEGHPC